MKTRHARQIREGILFGQEWSRCMFAAQGSDLLMAHLDWWSRTHGRRSNRAATRAIRADRLARTPKS